MVGLTSRDILLFVSLVIFVYGFYHGIHHHEKPPSGRNILGFCPTTKTSKSKFMFCLCKPCKSTILMIGTPETPKQPFINGCFNWMMNQITKHKNGWKSPFPSIYKAGCLGFQVIVRHPVILSDILIGVSRTPQNRVFFHEVPCSVSGVARIPKDTVAIIWIA